MSADDAARLASDALHARVRAFASAALGPESAAPASATPASAAPAAAGGPETFEALALDIARFQMQHNPAVARLCRYRGVAHLGALAEAPAVPADAFRLGRVAAFPAPLDVAGFFTSGTTGGSGRHAFRTLATYEALSVAWGARALLREAAGQRWTVLGLAAPFEPERRSSLGYMMQAFMVTFDGRGLHASGPFEPHEPGRWLIQNGAVDVDGLRRGARVAASRGEPVLLLATSFALVWLLDRLAGAALPLPPGSVVMFTGGFKGRARSVDGTELGESACRALALEPANLIGEYGMTELSSQLYDGGFGQSAEGQSVFVEPPWLRVTPVDSMSLEPVEDGETGLARFTDLANVDSALNVLTQDRVRRVPGGIVLLGRQAGARLRGCSLAVELLAAWQPTGASIGRRGLA